MNNLSHIFKRLETAEPTVDLEQRILLAIEREKNIRIQHRLWFSYVGLLGSFFALLYGGTVFVKMFFESDFLSLLSLIFSDAAVVAHFWNTFLLSLLETIPVFPLLLFFAPVFALFFFLNMYFSIINNQHVYEY